MNIVRKQVNEVTGQRELLFMATLKGISQRQLRDDEGNPTGDYEPAWQDNSQGTKYVVGNIEFKNAQGEVVKRTGQIWESLYSRVEKKVGEEVLCTAAQGVDESGEPMVDDAGKPRIFIKISHLQGGSFASIEDFGEEAFSEGFEEAAERPQVSVSQRG